MFFFCSRCVIHYLWRFVIQLCNTLSFLLRFFCSRCVIHYLSRFFIQLCNTLPFTYFFCSRRVIHYFLPFLFQVCNTLPFKSQNRKTLVKLQLENKINFPWSRRTSDEFQDLVKKILQPKIKKRCVVAKMGKHPWFKKKKKWQPFRL